MSALSFNNDPALKALHVAQAEHHYAADMLISGTYGQGRGESFRACSVGCFAHEIDAKVKDDFHAVVAGARALPEWLIRLQDSIFEGLPEGERETFHVDLAKWIPVGADLEPVQHWLAVNRIDRMLVTQRAALAKNKVDVKAAIAQVIAALEVGRRANEAAAGGNSCELSAAEAEAWKNERDGLFSALDRAGASA